MYKIKIDYKQIGGRRLLEQDLYILYIDLNDIERLGKAHKMIWG